MLGLVHTPKLILVLNLLCTIYEVLPTMASLDDLTPSIYELQRLISSIIPKCYMKRNFWFLKYID